MKKLIFSILMLLFSTSISLADPISFEATINSSKISLNDALQLTLTFTGVKEDLDPISLPTLDGFSTKYVGPSTSVSIVNGDYSSQRSFIYDLFPNKVGHFQIPSISATIEGQTYSTKPIDVDVVDSSTANPAGSPDNGSQGPTVENLKDKIKILVSVDRQNAYLNESIPLSIKLLVNDLTMRDIQFSQFEKQAFDVDDFQKPDQYSQVIDGIKYDVVEFKTNIYPNRLGDVTLGPIQIQGNILYQTTQNNGLNQSSFFGSDMFNNFFNSYQSRPVVITAPLIPMHISALPLENRPNDFSGAIGPTYDFQATVSPTQVTAGDPLTLKMDIKGNGNLKNFQMPAFQSPGFKTYPPQIKGGVGEKTAQEVIIPTSVDIKEVPALHFSYFDTSSNAYKTINQGPFPIQVSPPSPDQQFKAVGFTDMNKEATPVIVNQFSFGNIFQNIYKSVLKLFKSLYFWVAFTIVFSGGSIYILWRKFQDRLENDPAFARRFKAAREAKQALSQAPGFISAGKSKDFYAIVSKVLRDYLANKWHESSAALSNQEILEHLKSSQIDEGHILQIKTLLEQSDLVCFAGANFDGNKMQADLAQTQDLILYLESKIKARPSS